jgi:hypothetical protein
VVSIFRKSLAELVFSCFKGKMQPTNNLLFIMLAIQVLENLPPQAWKARRMLGGSRIELRCLRRRACTVRNPIHGRVGERLPLRKDPLLAAMIGFRRRLLFRVATARTEPAKLRVPGG